MSADERLLAAAALSRVLEPGHKESFDLVSEHGVVEAWRRLRAGAAPRLRALAGPRLDDCRPERDLATAARVGARLVVRGDPDWPTALDEVSGRYSPPFALWVRGGLDLAGTAARSVAVVGSRASTRYGDYVAAELGTGLAERGWTVVSGGAYGIDGAAHRGALAAGGPTVAVLACGVDVAYPRGHDALFAQVAAAGLLISEWPPGCAPQRSRFLVRNRVIAALSRGTVVVEAAARSGALNTAAYAGDAGRPVMAVPGPVTSTMSAGSHALLRAGATAVTNAAEVIEEVGALGVDLAPRLRGGQRPGDELDEATRRVLDAVPVRSPAGAARIAAAAGVDLSTVLRGLGALDRAGYVERAGDRWRLTGGRAHR